MKDLDQPSLSSLRRYGVRFVAYHIYLPALFKPTARALGSRMKPRLRPPPKPVVVEAAAAGPVPGEAAVEAVSETGTDAAAELVAAAAEAVATETPPSAALLPDVPFSAVESESEPTA